MATPSPPFSPGGGLGTAKGRCGSLECTGAAAARWGSVQRPVEAVGRGGRDVGLPWQPSEGESDGGVTEGRCWRSGARKGSGDVDTSEGITQRVKAVRDRGGVGRGSGMLREDETDITHICVAVLFRTGVIDIKCID